MLGIPETRARIMWIEHFDPPAELGWLPRPSWGLAVCPVENLGEENAGYMLYLDTGEPVQIDAVRGSSE
jgi:hypothetical protein